MKIKLTIWLTLLLVMVAPLFVHADVEQQEISFCVSEDDPSTADHVLNAALKQLGYKLSVTSLKLSSALVSTNSGQFDGMGLQYAGLENTYKNLVMVPESVGDVSFYVYVRDGDTFAPQSWEDFRGKKVSYEYQRNHTQSALNAVNAECTEATSKKELFQFLLDGTVDAIVVPRVLHTYIYTPKGISFASSVQTSLLYTYVNKKYDYLAPLLAEQYRMLKKSGEMDNIIDNVRTHDRDDKKMYLYISSYEESLLNDNEIGAGLMQELSADPSNLIYTLSLNANVYTNQESRLTIFAEMMRADFLDRNPDAIIVSDRYALDFLKENYYQLFAGTPVVFCGQNDTEAPPDDGFEAYFHGIPETLPVADTVQQMLRLYPDTKNIFVINDYLPDGMLWRRAIEAQMTPFADKLNVVYNGNVHLSELLTTVRNLPPNTLILLGTYVVDLENRFLDEKGMVDKICAAATAPVFELNRATFGHGQLAGHFIDRKFEGAQAAQLAIRLAYGADEATLLEEQANQQQRTYWLFDYNVMEHFRLTLPKVPSNTTFINKKVTFKEANPVGFYAVVGVLAISTVLVIGLAIFMRVMHRQNKQLRETQKNLHSAEELLQKDAVIKNVKERLEKIIDSSPVAYMLLTKDGIVRELNAYAQETFGIQQGMSIKSFYQNLDDRAKIIKKAQTQQKIFGEIVTYTLKNGDPHRFLINIVEAIFEGERLNIWWGVDIEASEQRKDSLEVAQRDLQKILDALPMPMFILAPNKLALVYGNKTYMNLFGLSCEQMHTPYAALNILPDVQENGVDSSSYVRAYVDSVSDASVITEQEIQHVLPNGERIETNAIATQISYRGQKGISVILQDISATKKQALMLENTANKEREANQLKSNFIINMSHEIRTPMNAIIGLAEVELHKAHAKATRAVFEKIGMSAKILLNIINDILDFSKIEAGKLDVIAENFVLEDVVSGAAIVASGNLADKDVEMMVRLDGTLPKFLYGDRTRLWQILKNILDNSAKYTNQGTITLTISGHEAPNGAVSVTFDVQDTGLGMTEEQMAKLYTPFQQFHEQAIKIAGTGLGMTITKQLISLMGGSILVASDVNQGTKTTIVIPFSMVDNSKSGSRSMMNDRLKQKHILVVARQPFLAQSIAEVLHSIDVPCVCVTSIYDAIDAITTAVDSGSLFDLVMTDYRLGEETAYDLAQALAQFDMFAALVLMVSPHDVSLVSPEEMKQAGFLDILEKPFVPSAFVHKLCDVLGLSAEVTQEDEYVQFGGARVLLCEDNYINQEVAIGMLSLYGIEPVIAQNGQEGIDQLEKEPFDLVLMDIAMPVMDGHEATVTIRASDKGYKDVPIIAMTANAMKEEVDKCMAEGMNGHVPKPIEIDKLYGCLLHILPLSTRRAATPQEPSDQ